MLPGTRAWLVLVAVVLCAGCARRDRQTEAGKHLRFYRLQTELEGKLKGKPAERRLYAAFFPVRVWLSMPAPSERERWSAGNYLSHLVDYVDQERPVEALPVLKGLMSLDFSHVAEDDGAKPTQGGVAELYVAIATKGMKPEEKARFLADLLRPHNRLAAWEAATRELSLLGEVGKRAVLAMLRKEAKTDLKDPGALKCAHGAQGPLVACKGARGITAEEVDELVALATKSDFVKLVVALYMSNRACLGFKADLRCRKFFRELWEKYPQRTDDDKPTGVRAVIMEGGGAITVPGNLTLMLHFLKSLDKEGPSRSGEALRSSVLGTISTEVERHGRSMDKDLRAYLTELTRRRIDVDPKNIKKNESLLRVADLFVRNQANALQILKKPKERAGGKSQ